MDMLNFHLKSSDTLLLCCFVDCSLADLWEEWDRGFLLPTGQRTRPFRELCDLDPKTWRVSHTAAMRQLLRRRRAIWIPMQKMFDRAQGNTASQKETQMLQQMEAFRVVEGCDKKLSNNKLVQKLKGFE